MNQRDEIIKEFLIESQDALDQLDRDLVTLERHPGDGELLQAIFRCIHTIKGTCGFFGFTRLEAVAHAGEGVLALMRDGRIALDAGITDALLRAVDTMRAILATIEATGGDGDDDVAALTHELRSIIDRYGRRPTDSGAGLLPGAALAPAALALAAAPTAAETSIRVNVDLLDSLRNLVGELALARTQLLDLAGALDHAGLEAATRRLNLITIELQAAVMKTRMRPIGSVWSRFPRLVRDMARGCGKLVALEMAGCETELDSTIIEAIKDPLTHIVRNAIDHGIEAPEARVAAGKPPEGRLCLRAFHEGGQVNIEISDDGAGMDPPRLRRAAVERGVLTADQAERMSDREIVRMVFLPGFSTAETVTNVSGRGVGMDVVRTNVERIGGRVDLETAVGRGTTLRIRIDPAKRARDDDTCQVVLSWGGQGTSLARCGTEARTDR